MIKIRRFGYLLVVLAVALLLGDDWQPAPRVRAVGRHARRRGRQLVPAGWSPLPEHVRRSIAPVYYAGRPA